MQQPDWACHSPYVDNNQSSDDPKLRQALWGEISPSMLKIKELNYLDLSTNDFGGAQILGFIGSLKQLCYFNLSGASFRGNDPSESWESFATSVSGP